MLVSVCVCTFLPLEFGYNCLVKYVSITDLSAPQMAVVSTTVLLASFANMSQFCGTLKGLGTCGLHTMVLPT